MTSVVYFANDDAGLVKIGSTADLPTRLRSVGNGRVSPMKLIGTIPGNHRHEHAVQRALEPYREHGDWFKNCPAVLRLIQDVLDNGFDSAGIAIPSERAPDDPLVEMVRSAALNLIDQETRSQSKMAAYSAVALMVGCSSSWLRRFVNGYPEVTLEFVTGVNILKCDAKGRAA